MEHKVLEVLMTFSAADVKNFRDFLNSPFFNDSKKLVKLYNELVRYYPKFELDKIKDEIFFPGNHPLPPPLQGGGIKG